MLAVPSARAGPTSFPARAIAADASGKALRGFVVVQAEMNAERHAWQSPRREPSSPGVVVGRIGAEHDQRFRHAPVVDIARQRRQRVGRAIVRIDRLDEINRRRERVR